MGVAGESIVLVGDEKTLAGTDGNPWFWEEGESRTYKVQTKYGLELIAKPNTRIATASGWVQVSDLKVGTQITTSPSSIYGQATQVPGFGFPWTRDVGRLIGLLTASGHLFTNLENGLAVGFDVEDAELAIYYQKVCANILGINSWTTSYVANNGKGAEGVRLRTAHSPVVRNFIRACVRDRVNPWLWNAPREGVLGFIEGYLCNNGTVDPSGGQLTLYTITTSERFAREFKLLLLYTTSVNAKIHTTVSERTADRQRHRIRIEKSNLPVFLSQVNLLRYAMLEKVGSSKQKTFRQDIYADEISSVQPYVVRDMYNLVTDDSPVFVNGFRIQ